jgi:hypothetical protein
MPRRIFHHRMSICLPQWTCTAGRMTEIRQALDTLRSSCELLTFHQIIAKRFQKFRFRIFLRDAVRSSAPVSCNQSDHHCAKRCVQLIFFIEVP